MSAERRCDCTVLLGKTCMYWLEFFPARLKYLSSRQERHAVDGQPRAKSFDRDESMRPDIEGTIQQREQQVFHRSRQIPMDRISVVGLASSPPSTHIDPSSLHRVVYVHSSISIYPPYFYLPLSDTDRGSRCGAASAGNMWCGQMIWPALFIVPKEVCDWQALPI